MIFLQMIMIFSGMKIFYEKGQFSYNFGTKGNYGFIKYENRFYS
jgi:hypothetical protein